MQDKSFHLILLLLHFITALSVLLYHGRLINSRLSFSKKEQEQNPRRPGYEPVELDNDGNVVLTSRSSEMMDALLLLTAAGQTSTLVKTAYQMRLCGLHLTIPDLKKLVYYLEKEGLISINSIIDDLAYHKN